jgi:hypothetical protein
VNIAFPSILLLFLSVPGIVLRRSYFAGRFSINFIETNIINEIVYSVIPAVVLHIGYIILIQQFTSYEILVDHFGYLVAGGNDKSYLNEIFSSTKIHLLPILLYNLSLIFIAFILGTVGRNIVRSLAWDRKTDFFRFSNQWHYLFTGEFLDSKELGWDYHNKIDFILVDILVDVNGQSVIYSGKLEDYFLKPGGGLDRIIIKYPSKKTFSVNGEDDLRDIPGNYLTIPFNRITNINTQYFNLDMLEDDNQSIESDSTHGDLVSE